uniref:LYR motif containing 4 n=3 Tax=Accipitrinae TaxID=8955 RepID=A0A663F3I7_AQUCH
RFGAGRGLSSNAAAAPTRRARHPPGALRPESRPPPPGAASAGEEPSGRGPAPGLALGPGRAAAAASPIRHSPPGRALRLPPPRLPPPLPARPWRRAERPARVAGRRLRGPARPRALRAGKGASPREDPPGVGNMAASSRAQVLRLYRALLRESQRFGGYNYRTYAIRRIRDAFRENKNIKDSEKIEELVNKAKVNLEVIHRQVTIGQLYSTQKLVIEGPGNT